MDRKRIEKIINDLDNISQKNYNDDFNLAIYIYVRYGLFEFNNYICDDELGAINQVLKRHSTIFDEDIKDEVKMILNHDNWED